MNADLESVDEAGETALILAARNGRNEAVKFLLSSGAKAKTSGKDGSTSLHAAASGGNLEVCKILLDAGSNVNSKSDMKLSGSDSCICC